MRLFPEWVREIRGRDASFFIEKLSARQNPKQSLRILEVGGGDGYIASLVHAAGFEIKSTDPSPREPLVYPVEVMEASRLPYDDNSFDAVISSNVLEHIKNLPESFAEMMRVLKPNGIMIHSMPTLACSIVTTLTAPPMLVRTWYYFLTGQLRPSESKPQRLPERLPLAKQINRRPRLARFCYRTLYAVWQLQPLRAIRFRYGHGEARGPIDELIMWRESKWRRRFEAAGLNVQEVHCGDLCCSMNKILPYKFMGLRGWLARHGWASTAFYLVAPAASETGADDESGKSIARRPAVMATPSAQ